MNKDIQAYNNTQSAEDSENCNLLAEKITRNLQKAENKICHAHPVWFLDGNPIVGYSRQESRLEFDILEWSGF
ncbi:MAG: hypothetical protein SH857_09045 [Chitinophagales bacterium]|nr:hypothetical protein [Chitinophagales bacterium]